MTVRQLLQSIDSRELSEWAALEAVEPWGARRDDLRMARHTAAMLNLHRSASSSPVTVGQCMLAFDEPEQPDDDELAENVNAIFGALKERWQPAP